MPPRRRRTRRRAGAGRSSCCSRWRVLAGVALWAYAPTLPAETLIARYANERSKLHRCRRRARPCPRRRASADGMPVVLIHGSLGSLHMWEGWARELGGTRCA